MKFLVEYGRSDTTLWICVNLLRLVGFLVRDKMTRNQKKLIILHAFLWFTISSGITIIAEIGDMIQIWGNVPFMVENLNFLLSNAVYMAQTINLIAHKDTIFKLIDEADAELCVEEREENRAIIQRLNKENFRIFLVVLITYGAICFLGWAALENGELIYRAWYPFDVSKSPAFEIAFIHQCSTLLLITIMITCMDMLVISLVGTCRCRFKLLQLSLRMLFHELSSCIIYKGGKHLLSAEDEKHVADRLRTCVVKHQAILASVVNIEMCFTYPILSQFTVSIVLLCFSAYNISITELDNVFWYAFVLFCLLGQVLQIFIYCLQGHYLSDESLEIADTVYETPWYISSVSLRRSLLIIMIRASKPSILTAGGFTTLSLACFISIVKVSYSFLSVLQQVDDK